MGLTDDQRAMLRLLAQNDDSYEDLAALKGVSVEQVRAEVREALAAAAEEQAPAQPTPAAEPKASPPAAKPKKAKPPRKARAPISVDRRRLLLWAGAAIAVVAIVLGAIAIFGGGGESGSSPSSGGGTATATENASSGNPKLTQAALKPVDGGEGEGEAVFGRLKKKIVMLVEAVGLEPTKQGESYAIWLYKSPKLAIRVASVEVSKSGGIRVPVQLTREIFAAVLARVFDKINLTRTNDAAYQAEVARAKKQSKLPRYTGETVLSGEVTGPVLKKE
jgi:pyruvate/2-oxoglutarate dehydrogenase complex dihydrolipoamide acyltransferase (E2) component